MIFSCALISTVSVSSKLSFSMTLKTEPKAIFCLSRYFKNSEDESFTPTQWYSWFNSASDNNSLDVFLISPCRFGIGSPCGSKSGCPKKASNLSINAIDWICSNSSAISWTSSQENWSLSTKKTSHKRCFLTIILADKKPFSVKVTPWYFW